MNANQDYKWASHIPLIQTALKFFPVDCAVEFGVGLHSTPLLSTCRNYLGIEQDFNWYKKTRDTFQLNSGQLIYLPFQYSSSKRESECERQYLHKYVRAIRTIDYPKSKTPILFIDNFVATRRLTFMALRSKFPIIMFHDAQLGSDHVYNYTKIDFRNGKLFYLCFLNAPWTGLWISDSLDEANQTSFLPGFLQLLNVSIDKYLQKYPQAIYLGFIRYE